jgi:hypothetical protein
VSLVFTALVLYASWCVLRRVTLGLVAIVMAAFEAASRLLHQLWRLEQRRRDPAAIESLLAG